MVIVVVMLLTASAAVAIPDKANFQPEGDVQKKCAVTTSEHQLSISSNDFCYAQRFGHTDWVHTSYIATMQYEQMLRSCLFDSQSAGLLTQTLLWYVRSTYVGALSQRWHPSIPIAHRKLII